MSRLDTMARFAEPEEKEPKVLAECAYCDCSLVEGQEVFVIGEKRYYCGRACLSYDTEQHIMGE